MRFGFVIPEIARVEDVVALAQEAEAVGWDGFFNWDSSYFEEPKPLYDAWVTLTAIAMRTERIRIGALLFALYRRRPWEVAREAVTLDHLSNGRLVMPVGLGATDAHGGTRFGLPVDRRTRAELLDESLAVLDGLWTGEPFAFAGKHHRFEAATFLPRPVQRPRIPLWVVGAWPSERSMARALRYDGVVVAKQGGELTPEDVRAVVAYARERRAAGAPFEVVVEGRTSADDPAAAAAVVRPWTDAGATWWVESMWMPPNDLAAVRTRLRAGPPRY